MASAKEKGKESEQEKHKEKNQDAAEVVHIVSDAESDPGLMIDEPAHETVTESAGTEHAMPLTSGATNATPLAMGVQTTMNEQGEEEAMDA